MFVCQRLSRHAWGTRLPGSRCRYAKETPQRDAEANLYLRLSDPGVGCVTDEWTRRRHHSEPTGPDFPQKNTLNASCTPSSPGPVTPNSSATAHRVGCCTGSKPASTHRRTD